MDHKQLEDAPFRLWGCEKMVDNKKFGKVLKGVDGHSNKPEGQAQGGGYPGEGQDACVEAEAEGHPRLHHG